MTTRRFVRDNLVLVAAFALPAAVAILFILATAIPRWTVAPPQHDLLLRAEQPYSTPPPDVSVEFTVRDGHVEAVVRPLARPENPSLGIPYAQRWALLLFDHATMRVRDVPLDLPRTLPAGETRTIVIDALAGRRVVQGDTAPDGYKVTSLNAGGGGGIVGELFGMSRRYQHGIAVGKDGRTIELDLPPPFSDSYGVLFPIGWMQDGNGR
jgi:hypothetical protein